MSTQPSKVMLPLSKLIGNTNKVLLSPDGSLNLIPFSALVDEQGRFLIEKYSFTYLTSGRDLLRLKNQMSSSDKTVIVASPDFGEFIKRSVDQIAVPHPAIDLSQVFISPAP